MQTVLEILSKTEAFFAQKGVPSPKTDAQLLLAHALECKRLELFLRFDEPLSEDRLAKVRELVRRRGRREPLQHILGTQEFFGASIKCDSRALIPRPETEELCEIISEKFFPDGAAPLEILDLGTGGGAIAVSLALRYPNARVEAVDKSADALALARENAALNGARVEFAESDWFERAGEGYDLVVSNPPYLTEEEVAAAEPEVRTHDPICALVSPDGGMADLKKILFGAADRLKPGGILALECGLGHAEKLAEMRADAGFADAEVFRDASRRARFAVFAKSAK